MVEFQLENEIFGRNNDIAFMFSWCSAAVAGLALGEREATPA